MINVLPSSTFKKLGFQKYEQTKVLATLKTKGFAEIYQLQTARIERTFLFFPQTVYVVLYPNLTANNAMTPLIARGELYLQLDQRIMPRDKYEILMLFFLNFDDH